MITAPRFMPPGEPLPIVCAPALLALDGEREILRGQGETWAVVLTCNGPRVFNVALTLREAQRQGLPHPLAPEAAQGGEHVALA
jgi:hypothetical protein